MKFTKIKYGSDGVELRWTTDSAKDQVAHVLTSKDKPEPEFESRLQLLVHHAARILDLPGSYEMGMKAVGVSLVYEEKSGRKGCVITCLKELPATSVAPACLNTPYLREPDIDDENPCMSDELVADLADLEAAARRYIEGKRAQQDLFASQPPESRKISDALMDAVESLRPEPGSGIESVTISSGGRSATLHARGSKREPAGAGAED